MTLTSIVGKAAHCVLQAVCCVLCCKLCAVLQAVLPCTQPASAGPCVMANHNIFVCVYFCWRLCVLAGVVPS